MTIRTRPEEDMSYSKAQFILSIVVVYFLIGSIVEAAMYWLFNYKVINKEFLGVVYYFLILAPSMEGNFK